MAQEVKEDLPACLRSGNFDTELRAEERPEAGGGGRETSWRRWALSWVLKIGEKLGWWAGEEERHFRRDGEHQGHGLGARNGAGRSRGLRPSGCGWQGLSGCVGLKGGSCPGQRPPVWVWDRKWRTLLPSPSLSYLQPRPAALSQREETGAALETVCWVVPGGSPKVLAVILIPVFKNILKLLKHI